MGIDLAAAEQLAATSNTAPQCFSDQQHVYCTSNTSQKCFCCEYPLRACSMSTQIADLAAHFQEHEIKTLFGRKVAIDASMSIYQFLIAVRQQDGQLLTNEAGETTRYGSRVVAPT